ncbi:MAG: hypothetical protein MUO50_11645 [Longimicrobiales bacterium]|nr:hypothetical protein [Longimicrobiales bacterium]
MSAMPTQTQAQKRAFLVIDAMDSPHKKGRIIRLRLQGGQPPALRDLKGATLQAQSPQGEKETLKVVGFFLGGGKPSNARLSRTGRVDLLVETRDGADRPMVSAQWEITGPQLQPT